MTGDGEGSTVGEQHGDEFDIHDDHSGEPCGLCDEPLEDEWVQTFEGLAHPECDEQRAAEATEAFRGDRG